ncbi:MAG: acyltransferase family protein, partial [Deferribacterota bacterium]|nr:acyltransferase family protein [Deferribacterota bacterium]
RGVLTLNFVCFFVIPFFFFLSGYVARVKQKTFKEYFAHKFSTLMIPMYIFNIMSMFLFFIVGIFYNGPLVEELTKYDLTELQKIMVVLFAGAPAYNFPTWFLTCLFTTSIFFYFIFKITKDDTKKLLIVIIILSITGYLMESLKNVVPNFHYVMYFWFIPTALTSTTFYLIGYLTRRLQIFEVIEYNKNLKYLFFIIPFILLVITTHLFGFYKYPEYESYRGGPYMNHLLFGNFFIFYFSAFLGIIMSTTLSMFVKKNKYLDYVGKRTLYLLGFIGFFYQFTTGMVVYIYAIYIGSNNYLFFICYCIFFALVQLLLSLLLMKPVYTIVNKSVDKSKYMLNVLLGNKSF